jgi:hypothetical protein
LGDRFGVAGIKLFAGELRALLPIVGTHFVECGRDPCLTVP